MVFLTFIPTEIAFDIHTQRAVLSHLRLFFNNISPMFFRPFNSIWFPQYFIHICSHLFTFIYFSSLDFYCSIFMKHENKHFSFFSLLFAVTMETNFHFQCEIYYLVSLLLLALLISNACTTPMVYNCCCSCDLKTANTG